MDIKKLEDRIVSYRESKGFETSFDNLPEKLMLVVCEIAEAMEAYRKPVIHPELGDVGMDEFNFGEELADAIIRILDITGSVTLPSGAKIDIIKHLSDKMDINEKRPYKHGKNC